MFYDQRLSFVIPYKVQPLLHTHTHRKETFFIERDRVLFIILLWRLTNLERGGGNSYYRVSCLGLFFFSYWCRIKLLVGIDPIIIVLICFKRKQANLSFPSRIIFMFILHFKIRRKRLWSQGRTEKKRPESEMWFDFHEISFRSLPPPFYFC